MAGGGSAARVRAGWQAGRFVAAKAHALVSDDRHLPALAGARGLCLVLGIEAFCSMYLGD